VEQLQGIPGYVAAFKQAFSGQANPLTFEDEYVFKVPTLRNIDLTPPYFHTGKAWDLRQAVAVMGSSQLGIALSDMEVDRITDFLHALTGEQPAVVYPILPASVAATPRPQP
jgi:cytochrome c peroxidase